MTPRTVDRRATLADVADRAMVSRATASRALRNDPRISERTRSVVRDAAEALEYIPNVAARSLRARKTRAFGLMLPELDDPVHALVADGFEQEASRAGYMVIILAARTETASEADALTVLIERRVDGICLVSGILGPTDARRRAGPIPVVLVQSEHERLRQRAQRPDGTIQTDDSSGMRQVVEHLLAEGYRDIAYLGPSPRASSRFRAVAAGRLLRANGVQLRVLVANGDAWQSPDLVGRVLGQDPAQAIICYDDKLALGLMDALRRRGLAVPRDVAVVGFDGIPFAALSNPRLTTVATPARELGQRAARALVEAVLSSRLPAAQTLAVELVVGESTPSRSRMPWVIREGVSGGV